MVSEKDYFELIKKLPSYKTSPELNYNIVEKCGISKGKAKSVQFMLLETSYGIACVGIIAIIFAVGFVNWDVESEKDIRLDSNAIAFVNQLAYGTKVVLTGQK